MKLGNKKLTGKQFPAIPELIKTERHDMARRKVSLKVKEGTYEES
jgi:hypothetical protein